MNIRSLTRGDGAVIGAAVLLLIASFLPFYSYPSGFGGDHSMNLWHSSLFPTLPSVTLAAVFAGAAVLASRSPQFTGKQVLGLTFGQWGVALSVFAGWSAIWATLFADDHGLNKGAGLWLTLIFGLVIGIVAPLSDRLPALKAPLAGAPSPVGQQPYAVGGPAGYSAAPQQAGYGYPGGAQSVDPAYGQQQPYGAQAPAPQAPQAPQPAAGAPDFSAFWFAVPVPRPLYAEDGSGSQIAELTPGTWYLAVDQRGAALIAQTQDGRRGVLQDSSGIQRG